MTIDQKRYWPAYVPLVATLLMFFLGVEFSMAMMFSFAIFIFFLIRNKNRELAGWLLLGFSLRVLVALLDRYFGLTHYEWDDYYTIALQLKRNLVVGVPIFNGVKESVHGLSYAVIGAGVYYIFGDYQILMRILNCFFGTLVADRVYGLTIALTGDRKPARIAALITLFFPSFIMFCSLDMRDAVIFFLTAEALYQVAQLMSNKKTRTMVVLAVELIALYFLRTQYLILFTLIVVIYWLMRSNLYKNKIQRYALLFLLMMVVWASYRYLQDLGFFPVLFKVVNADMNWRTAGGSAYLVGVNYETWWDVIRWMPLRMIHFALGPFPWTVNNFFMLLACVESIALVVILLMAVSSEGRSLYGRYPRLYLFLILFSVMGLVSSAVIDSNYGTAMRHKMNFVFVFIIFSSPYISKLRMRIV